MELINACSEGQMDVIDSLLEAGVDVNATDIIGGGTALKYVCLKTEPWVIDVVTKLIIYGADVDLEDNCWDNALSSALLAKPFQPHVAQLVLDCSKSGINRLDQEYANYLWYSSTLEATKFLVQNGIDVNNVFGGTTYLDICYPNEEEYLRSVGAKLYSEL